MSATGGPCGHALVQQPSQHAALMEASVRAAQAGWGKGPMARRKVWHKGRGGAEAGAVHAVASLPPARRCCGASFLAGHTGRQEVHYGWCFSISEGQLAT